MKICVVTYRFGTKKEMGQHLGTYYWLIKKMKTLIEKGQKIYVVCPWLSFTKRGSKNVDGIEIIRYWPPLMPDIIRLWPWNRIVRWLYIKQTQKNVLQTIKEKKINIVYVWQARETGYAIAEIKEKLGVPFFFRQITAWHWHFKRPIQEIFGLRSWYPPVKKIIGKRILEHLLEFLMGRKSQIKFAKIIYQKADKIVFLSRAAIKEAEEIGLAPNKAVELGMAIEQDLFKPLGQKEKLRQKLQLKGQKIILFIGRINFAEKGIGYLLKAMPEIISIVPQVNLIIIGEGGESERMNKLIKKLNLKNNVQLLGRKPFIDLVRYINAADVCVIPSVWMEAFGYVNIQAMSCGIPIVTFDAGAAPEINIDGKTGFVVPARNSHKLAEAIIKILTNEHLQKQLGQNARQRVLQNYTYNIITDRLLSIFKNYVFASKIKQ